MCNENSHYNKTLIHSVAVGLFHEWAGCCIIFSTPFNSALIKGNQLIELAVFALFLQSVCFMHDDKVDLYFDLCW